MRRLVEAGLVFLLLTAALFSPLQAAPQLTDQEWNNIKSEFKSKYSGESPEERLGAINLLSNVSRKFGNANQAIEALQLILGTLPKETDGQVVQAALNYLTGLPISLYGSQALDWLVKNHKKAVSDKTAQLRLVEVLGKLAQDKRAGDKIIQTLLDLLSDADAQVVSAVLDILAKLKEPDTIEPLIQQLSKESREEIRDKISRTLQEITGEKYGPNASDWQEWWKEAQKKKIPQEKIDQAINQGRDYLLKQWEKKDIALIIKSNDLELLTYTLIHAGVSLNDPLMKQVLEELQTKAFVRTYNVALLAMVLCDADRVKYQARLIQCAQWLLGNESNDGNWHYGVPVEEITPLKPTTPGPEPEPEPKPSDPSYTGARHKVKILIPPRRKTNTFDNSNTQYALLGLRACAEAGIEIPKEAWRDAEKHFRKVACSDGGWGYMQPAAARGKPSASKGYGSMTAGGLASLVICLHWQGKPYKLDAAAKSASKWLTQNFTVKGNPLMGQGWHYYYLYALERAGVIYGTEFFGKNEWYQVGAKYLLDEQAENGAWNNNVQDTCFAILFLRRATQTLKPIETK